MCFYNFHSVVDIKKNTTWSKFLEPSTTASPIITPWFWDVTCNVSLHFNCISQLHAMFIIYIIWPCTPRMLPWQLRVQYTLFLHTLLFHCSKEPCPLRVLQPQASKTETTCTFATTMCCHAGTTTATTDSPEVAHSSVREAAPLINYVPTDREVS